MDTMEQPQEEQTTPHYADHKKGGFGAALGIIVIIVLLALGGLYYFTQGVPQVQNTQMSAEEEAAMTASEEEALRAQGSSTNVADIEADIKSTDLSGLDKASAGFEAELRQ